MASIASQCVVDKFTYEYTAFIYCLGVFKSYLDMMDSTSPGTCYCDDSPGRRRGDTRAFISFIAVVVIDLLQVFLKRNCHLTIPEAAWLCHFVR